MHLIYKINFKSGKVYIGQTINLIKRKTDHLKEARNGNNSKVYRAMRKYNTTRDDFEIIETGIQTQEEADSREIYWIQYYDSYHNGYNSTTGGDANIAKKGEEASNAIFTNKEILEIRKLKAEMKYSKKYIYNLYKNRISESGFNKIWNFEVYTEVGQEYNTKEIIEFYKHSRISGSSNKCCKFSNEEIINIRNQYYINVISTRDIAKSFSVNKSTIERIVSGKTYSDIPLPIPSIKFKRKYHVYTEDEINAFINAFIKSKLNIKKYLEIIKSDENNIFGGYVYSAFREFIIRELKNRGYEYKANNKWRFEIIKISN